MNRIEIRGVIVPSIYDSEWAQKYIEKGIITPESTFRNALKKCDTAQPLEIYINSPGGSIFSAYEMVNAVKEWKVQNKQPANIIIGAMAASAASIITIFVGSSVKVHKNAKMMFHGASTETYGGQGAHEDSVALLGKINTEVQQVLIQKYKMSPDTVAEWFAEGRMGWLTAEEMIKIGIASEIIPDDADAIAFDDAVIKAIDEQGLDIAACLEKTMEEKPMEVRNNGTGKPLEGSAINLEVKPVVGVDPPNSGSSQRAGNDAPAQPGNADAVALGQGKVEMSADERSAFERGYAEGRTEAEAVYAQQKIAAAESAAKVKKDNAELDGLQRRMQGERDSARAQVEKLSATLAEATGKIERLLSGGMSFAPSIETWADALKACNSEYETARKQYPDLFREERERAKANRK